jgi:hypothetical protein
VLVRLTNKNSDQDALLPLLDAVEADTVTGVSIPRFVARASYRVP